MAAGALSLSGRRLDPPTKRSDLNPFPPLHLQHVNRLMYRARQRGWLELDLLVGMWAEREVARLQPDVLTDFETLLNEENPDLYKWLTGQLPPPKAVGANKAFKVRWLLGFWRDGPAAAASATARSTWPDPPRLRALWPAHPVANVFCVLCR